MDCPKVNEDHGRCEGCRHRLEGEDRALCGLTRAALPLQGGCCHWNVELTQGPQKVIRAMLLLIEVNPSEPVLEVLNLTDVPYRSDQNGDLFVDPDDLPLPDTYGLGTDHLAEEVMDWPDWAEGLEP